MAAQATTITIPNGALPQAPDGKKALVAGYPMLAGHMGVFPQMGIFRRFGALNTRNLLYLQAELVYLEQHLIEVEEADQKSLEERRSDFCSNWLCLSDSIASQNPETSRQWKLVLQIRDTLKQYNETLIQQAAVASMLEPSDYDLDYIQHYFESEEMAPGGLVGEDKCTWGTVAEPHLRAQDLISLHPPRQEDAFSRWFTHKAMDIYFKSWFHRRRKPSKVYGKVMYKEHTLLRITHFITSIVASMLPIISITVLWSVKSAQARLGIVAGFTLLLTVCLTAFTSASKAEVFAVTNAFAAVLVVFVGFSLSGSKGGGGCGNSSCQ